MNWTLAKTSLIAGPPLSPYFNRRTRVLWGGSTRINLKWNSIFDRQYSINSLNKGRGGDNAAVNHGDVSTAKGDGTASLRKPSQLESMSLMPWAYLGSLYTSPSKITYPFISKHYPHYFICWTSLRLGDKFALQFSWTYNEALGLIFISLSPVTSGEKIHPQGRFKIF